MFERYFDSATILASACVVVSLAVTAFAGVVVVAALVRRLFREVRDAHRDRSRRPGEWGGD